MDKKCNEFLGLRLPIGRWLRIYVVSGQLGSRITHPTCRCVQYRSGVDDFGFSPGVVKLANLVVGLCAHNMIIDGCKGDTTESSLHGLVGSKSRRNLTGRVWTHSPCRVTRRLFIKEPRVGSGTWLVHADDPKSHIKKTTANCMGIYPAFAACHFTAGTL